MVNLQDSEKKLANSVRDKLRVLRSTLSKNPNAPPLLWLLPSRFACSQRPLRDHPVFGCSAKPLPLEAGPDVIGWAERVAASGIKSVVCLMHAKELKYYDGLRGMADGLLALYKRSGFEVRHIEWADPAHEKTPEARAALRNRVGEIKKEAYSAFRQLPKPVLLHCSAGIDRSAPVAAHIILQEDIHRATEFSAGADDERS